jgi:hypothetical protein
VPYHCSERSCPNRGNIYDVKDSFYEQLESGFDKLPKYQTKILLGDFISKVRGEYIFNQTIGNETLHEIINDNRVRVVNFAISKNLTVKSTMFPHRNNHKCHVSPDTD